MSNETRAFTLLEILIIFLIITLLAVIIVPQLSRADNEDKLTEMVSILQNVRSHIQLYRIQHFGLLPGQDTFEGCLTVDGAHFNEKGNRLFADLMLKGLGVPPSKAASDDETSGAAPGESG